MNENIVYKNSLKTGLLCLVLILLAGLVAGAGIGRSLARASAEREIAERDRLIGEYRTRDVETARTNRELAARNRKLEKGLSDIREIAGSAGGNIRQAIAIISGVKSILETLEAGGAVWHTDSAGGGDNSRPLIKVTP